jgi:hypothetical protein
MALVANRFSSLFDGNTVLSAVAQNLLFMRGIEDFRLDHHG